MEGMGHVFLAVLRVPSAGPCLGERFSLAFVGKPWSQSSKQDGVFPCGRCCGGRYFGIEACSSSH